MGQLSAPLAGYVNDPVGFARDILGFECWPGQCEILESVRDNPRTSVAHCFGADDPVTAASILLWWMMTRRPATAFTTAATQRANECILWREVCRLHKEAIVELPGSVGPTYLELSYGFARGLNSDAINKVVGVQATNGLVIEFDASGIKPEVSEDCECLFAGSLNGRHLRMGVPNSSSGAFYDSHMDPEVSKLWKRITINAIETPNYIEGREVVPGMVTRDWVDTRRRDWLGRGHIHPWKTKVLGEFHPHPDTVAQPKDMVPFSTSDQEGVNSPQPAKAKSAQDYLLAHLDRLERALNLVTHFEDNNMKALFRGMISAHSEMQAAR